MTTEDRQQQAQRIGKRIRDAREDAGLSQRQLGDAVVMDHTAISRIERGRGGVPTQRTLKYLADALGVSVEELTGGK